ncbi:hypothetical protein BIV57_18485 [Mangrovactinospora gilvigrisea]|uniref:HTH lysR-type domain-containing protein n=1 Tax=Mangrovactinospora gilvigrisea TaxID=1428644 RepID=A0A1J7BBI1_9ACTN|nr:LysR family transcriptional regulator [Mangrovactinospora gilvigrisea]OIV36039.1 hypothetical protein BIV57_18485 [Mangrovactinospora gilvigrisea]
MIDHRVRALRALAREGTVTAAAEALHLTPSTVSVQLRQLAAELGVRLLEQDGRRVRLTPAARVLLEHAEVMYGEWERLQQDLERFRPGDGGPRRLRVTAVASALAAVVAPAVRALSLENGRAAVAVEVTEDPEEDRLRLLAAGTVDAAVVIPVAGEPALREAERLGIRQFPLLTEPMDLLVPAGHRLARRSAVAFRELADESWIRAGDPRDQHQLLLAAAEAAGFRPRVAHGAVDWHAVAGLVGQGFGVCLYPRTAPDPSGPAAAAARRVRLSGGGAAGAVPSRRIVAAVREGADESPGVARLLLALQDAGRRVAERQTPDPAP